MANYLIVQNDTQRFKLTYANVKLNDVVKVLETNNVYKVIDINNLDSEKGYSIYLENPLSAGGTINGDLNVKGNIVATGNITAFSDERVKKNIRNIDNEVIEKLKQVKFYNFEYKDCKIDRKRVGVIAQELELLFPELVFENQDGIKSVDYVGLNTYFSFAIQQKLLGL